MEKHLVVRALIGLIEDEMARATSAANKTRADAVHDEARPENDKDTRALEASYLARGQAQRVVDLQAALKRLAFMELRTFGPDDAIELSALVQLESGDERRWYFLAVAGGGRRVEQDGVSIHVVTPEAPLGRALVGKSAGADVTLRAGGRDTEWIVCAVR